ncbi:hypothetical protein MKZ38_002282 [Zalerion maritima]|uniref:Uncharacterized protein n=1 Tax=Zalerion maritima TaxID=339359 RepID=A0AAD5WMI5_9PEZI|nr:hypothetical protein MKZ38_002282 [Zalerion maritima]
MAGGALEGPALTMLEPKPVLETGNEERNVTATRCYAGLNAGAKSFTGSKEKSWKVMEFSRILVVMNAILAAGRPANSAGLVTRDRRQSQDRSRPTSTPAESAADVAPPWMDKLYHAGSARMGLMPELPNGFPSPWQNKHRWLAPINVGEEAHRGTIVARCNHPLSECYSEHPEQAATRRSEHLEDGAPFEKCSLFVD